MKRAALALYATVVLSAGCAPALKDVRPTLAANDSGGIWFATAGSLARSADGTRFLPADPVVISGDLRFPSGPGPFPAVILAHGCGGVGNAETAWAPDIREWGYATLVLDSFRARNLTEVCTNPRALNATQRIPDAYGALRILATHPRIDARRIALMGFSHGGMLTLEASTQWARDTYAPAGQPSFRAFFPFYPYCNTMYPERDRVSAPVRVHMGELDDWLPVGPCIRLVERLKASGQDAIITVYAGAHHSFDNVGRPVTFLPNVVNPSGCSYTFESILGPFPGSAATLTCLGKGATIGWSPDATKEARGNMKAQLGELLR